MKRYRLVLFLFFTLSVLLTNCNTNSTIEPWNLVDESSILVFEGATISDAGDTISFSSNKRINTIIKDYNTNLLVALQRIGNGDFGLVYLTIGSKSIYEGLISKLKADGLTINERLLSGIMIHESIDPKEKTRLSLAFIKGTISISESSFLVENCVRISSKESKEGFKKSKDSLFRFSFVRGDKGNLFFNEKEFYNTISFPKWIEKIVPVKEINNSLLLDVKSSTASYLLNGFSISNDSLNKWPRTFQKFRPVPIELTRFIPATSKYLFHFGISDFKSFIKDHRLNVPGDFDRSLGDELVFCDVPGEDDFISIIELNDTTSEDRQKEYFDQNSSLFESYAGCEIRETPASSSLGVLLSSFVTIAPKLVYVVKENSIFVSSSVSSLKLIIDAIDAEETWGRSVEFQRFFEKSLQESNYSLVLKDVSLHAKNSLKLDSLLKFFKLDYLKWGSLQHSSLDDHFYTNINLQTKSGVVSNSPQSKLNTSEIQIPSTIRSFHIIQNHDGNDNLILEDETKFIYLISDQNKVQWKYSLAERIEGDVRLIDFYKNQKWQYFIPTTNKLYLIDRLGRNVNSYPLDLNSPSSFSTVVDYDKSKNYRFLFAGDQSLYLFDKQKKTLEGWNPKRFENFIQYAPIQQRIGGKDYFLVVLKDGSIHLFNRRGDYQNGYPFKLDAKFSGDYFLEAGQSLSSTVLHFATSEGELIRFNLGDLKVDKENLVKSNQATFSLKLFSDRSSIHVLRIDATKIASFDRFGKMIFEVVNPGSMSLHPSILSSRNDALVYSFFDADQKIAYLFDQAGRSFKPNSIECTLPLQISYDKKSDQVVVYAVNGNVMKKILID